MKSNLNLKQRLRYRFDNVMSKGVPAQLALLTIISMSTLVIVTGLILGFEIALHKDEHFVRVLWTNFILMLDPGTAKWYEEDWTRMIFSLIILLGGLLVVSILIGVFTSGIETKINQLRSGRSFVAVENHTLILGWNRTAKGVISELILANENVPSANIVILANHNKVEMDEEIAEEFKGRTGSTSIITRSGDPISNMDLNMVNINASKSIIIIPPENDNPDIEVIKLILSIRNNTFRRKAAYHIVSSIYNADNFEAAQLAGGDEVELIKSQDIIARITAQTCVQSGLPHIYRDLFDYAGSEIYFSEMKQLEGTPFGDTLSSFNTSCPIGIFTKDEKVRINPPFDTVIQKGDQIIAISEDDDTVVIDDLEVKSVRYSYISKEGKKMRKPERTIILGWNNKVSTIVNELAVFFAAGSEVVIITKKPDGESFLRRTCPNINNLKLTYVVGDSSDKSELERYKVHEFNNIIVLGDSEIPPEESDAKVLIKLLQVRLIIQSFSKSKVSIIGEIMSERNRKIAEVAQVDDFIVGSYLIGLLYSQIAENKHLNTLFTNLLSGGEGAEIYIKSVSDYIIPKGELSFYTVVESVKRYNEIAIGYRIVSEKDDESKGYGIYINPVKSKPINFSEEDQVIIIADDF